MNASILAIATQVPEFAFKQLEVAEIFKNLLNLDQKQTEKIYHLHQNSAIHTRYSVLPNFQKTFQNDFLKTNLGMTERNHLYKQEAPKLAYEVANQALLDWGGDLKEITHIISVSCTGLMAPGIEFILMQQLGLNSTVQRLAINFMGCFGAFKGLSLAASFAKENEKHRILVVCVELCSLHFQAEQTIDNMLGNAIFSDGAAALIVGAKPKKQEKSLWNILKMASLALEHSLEKMSWEATNYGFILKLSQKVPVLIARKIEEFLTSFLSLQLTYEKYDWAIHPGGKSILQALEKALHLTKDMTRASWEVLANYGNMSSATFLFVLKHLQALKKNKQLTVGLAFGPGLSVEGILLENHF